MKHFKILIFIFLLFFMSSITIQSTDQYVILGGDSVAIILKYDGVYVTGRYPFDYEGKSLDPYHFSIKQNDIILSIDGVRIHTIEDYYKELSNYKKDSFIVPITVSRNHKILNVEMAVSFHESTGMYKTGLYIKDELSGVGTLTFFNPMNRTFGALGHSIIDRQQGTYLKQDGLLFYSYISSYSKSTTNHIGEKYATLSKASAIGPITKSNEYGIYGNYQTSLTNRVHIKIGKQDEVQLGEAFMYTVISGDKIEKYAIEITEIRSQRRMQEKGITFRIVDKRLLNQTGGIIQGMSGSPIIQNGKLIGAVTHVFVNDPTRGYGIFIENMLEAAE